MREELLKRLRPITEEEQTILDGQTAVQRNLYTSKNGMFTIDSEKLLQKGHLIEIRPHTRFIHFPKHQHNYVEVVYMCSGSTTHIINDRERIVLEEGDLLFLNQHVTQEILPAGEEDIAVNFIILPEFFDQTFAVLEQKTVLRDFLISSLSQSNSTSSHLCFRVGELPPVQNLIENMIWTLFQKKPGTNSIYQTTMELLFLNLAAFAESISQENPNQYEQDLVFRVIKYVESNYKDGTLTDIAQELNLPDYYISRLLKKHAKTNFKNLLQQRKLQQAAYLLTQTTLSVEDIMNAIGYNNSSYFYNKFHLMYNCSPAGYRKNFYAKLHHYSEDSTNYQA